MSRPEQAESLLHDMASRLGGDPAATDARVLRVAGLCEPQILDEFVVQAAKQPTESIPGVISRLRTNRPKRLATMGHSHVVIARPAIVANLNVTGRTRNAPWPEATTQRQLCSALPIFALMTNPIQITTHRLTVTKALSELRHGSSARTNSQMSDRHDIPESQR